MPLFICMRFPYHYFRHGSKFALRISHIDKKKIISYLGCDVAKDTRAYAGRVFIFQLLLPSKLNYKAILVNMHHLNDLEHTQEY